MLPTFMIAGVQKSGTTSLHRTLDQHPDIFFPADAQEICFFADESYGQGLDFYEAYFAGHQGETAVGQTCPIYISTPAVPARIQAVLPAIKLIFILRNPVDRTYSHYWHNVKKGREERPFAQALAEEAATVSKGAYEAEHYCYQERSSYSQHIKRFLNHFPQEQIKIMLLEDLEGPAAPALADLLAFIGVEATVPLASLHQNRARLPWSPRLQEQYVPKITAVWPWLGRRVSALNRTRRYDPLSTAMRRELWPRFVADVAELERLSGRDLSAWRRQNR